MIFATQSEGSVIYQQLPPLAIIIISTPHRTEQHNNDSNKPKINE